MSMFILAPSDMHPYNCHHDRHCEHCTLAETYWHDPKACGLCDWLGDGKLHRFVKEPYARRVWVRDRSHRRVRVLVRREMQQELPL